MTSSREMPPKKGHLTASRQPQSLPTRDQNVTDQIPPLADHDQLRRENENLRRQLDETQKMMNQLFLEQSRESYDKRRVMLLKAQLYQTERQLLLLQDGMARRTASLWEAENILKNVKSQCQSLATGETSSPAPEVTIPRSQLFRLIEDVEKARSGLFRRLQRDEGEKFSQLIPNKFSLSSSSYTFSGQEDASSLIDMLTGSKPLLCLKKVAAIESDVFDCYGEVKRLCTDLAIISDAAEGERSLKNNNNGSCSNNLDGNVTENRNDSNLDFVPSILYSPAVIAKLGKSAEKTRQSLEDLGSKLLEVSLLVPLSHHPPSRPTKSATEEPSLTTASPNHLSSPSIIASSSHHTDHPSTPSLIQASPHQPDPPSSASLTTAPPSARRVSRIDAKMLLQKFPRQTIAKSRVKEVASVLEAFVRISESQRLLDEDQNRHLREELDGLAKLIQIQNGFVSDVISLTEKSYLDFYSELSCKFSSPVGVISSAFQKVEADPVEENFRLFILTVRQNYGALVSLQRYLQRQQTPANDFDLLQLGFREKMDLGLKQLALKRETHIADIVQKKSNVGRLQDICYQ